MLVRNSPRVELSGAEGSPRVERLEASFGTERGARLREPGRSKHRRERSDRGPQQVPGPEPVGAFELVAVAVAVSIFAAYLNTTVLRTHRLNTHRVEPAGVLPIAINLYSVRALDEPLFKTIDRVADAGYDGVQFSGGLDSNDPADVRDRLDDHGLDAVGPHVGVGELESDPDATAGTYRDLGTSALVVPYLDPDAFESRETVEATADRLSKVAEDFDSRGFDLHYHNHDHEFVALDGRTAFERLFDAAPGLGAEIDVGWVATAGHDPEALLREYGDRLSLVHMKDMHTSEGAFAEIGEGDVDMAACADAAHDVDADWLIYEHDDPENPVESIETGASFLGSLRDN